VILVFLEHGFSCDDFFSGAGTSSLIEAGRHLGAEEFEHPLLIAGE